MANVTRMLILPCTMKVSLKKSFTVSVSRKVTREKFRRASKFY